MKRYSIYFFGLILLLTSCRHNVQEAPRDLDAEAGRKKEKLIDINNYVARRNNEMIARFVKRTNLNMKETGSGLWYGIYFKGKGREVKSGNIVKMSYSLRLLDGTPIDSAGSDHPKIFRTGKGGVESGLEEGVMLLHQGDSARFIIPPHLAYGNFGNQEKIPPGAFLFYDVYLSEVTE
ncbi:MAG: FKBP-type peptidyl-prolyl cis-trans isomerase [Bacteroidales bacterium]|nr:FKBP-type peptidyl-prolyl cis-trans isomerase [Bacteroidales bacterium]